MLKKIHVFYLSLLFMIINVSAFSLADLDGKVTDANTSSPISGAIVTAYRNGVFVDSDTTDANGDYSIIDLKPGQYVVVASKAGYETAFEGGMLRNNQTTTVNFSLESNTGTIAGQVTEEANPGTPISGASIDIYQADVLVASTTTNPSGNYSVATLSPGSYIVVSSALGFETDFIGATVVASQTTTLNFALEANPGSITGTVINSGAAPIEDAAILIFQDNTLIDTTSSDVNGTYQVLGLAPGSYSVVALAVDFQSQIKSAIVLAAAATTVNFTLAADPGIIAGRVTDTSNNPISRAEVDVFLGSDLITSTITDSNGEYDFEELSPASYIVVAKAEDFQTDLIGATVVSNQTTIVNFSLFADPGTLSGKVTDNLSVAIPGAVVAVFEGTNLIDTALSDSLGNYQITGLAPASYTVVATAEDFQLAFASVAIVSNQTTTQNFTLLPDPGTINGQVTATTGGAPIEGATILVFQGSNLIDHALTDSSGNYEVTSLAPATYTVIAGAENFQLDFASVAVLANQTIPQNFSLDADPGILSGQVTDLGTSLGVAGVQIEVFDGSVLISSAVTDSSGNYEIDNLPAGTFTVNASANNYVSNSSPATIVASQTTTLDFVLTPIPLAVGSLAGAVIPNRFLTQTDRIHRLIWTESNSTNLREYRIKRNSVIIQNVSPSTLKYDDHNRNGNVADTYIVTALNSFGQESDPRSITLK